MTSACNINVYFKYTVNIDHPAISHLLNTLKHAVQLNSLFLFTNIVKHAFWFMNFPYYHICVFVSGKTKIFCSRFNYEDFTEVLW